ncbi:MAG: DUF3795 domain-containing protein [Bacillota bacterium]
MMNKCGCFCDGCPTYQKECPGCEEVSGRPFWTEHIGGEACPMYACCDGKAYANCGECGEMPCKIWYEMKDPSWTDEEHINSINERIGNLKKACGTE